MSTIYTNNGADRGERTRLLRACPGGVEWTYAVDHAAGHRRWFAWGMAPGQTIETVRAAGMDLTPYHAPGTELTATGEQFVIPGCERNAPQSRARQLDLFG